MTPTPSRWTSATQLGRQSFDRSAFSSIEVFLRSGNGRFRVDQIHGAFADEALTVHGAVATTRSTAATEELGVGSLGVEQETALFDRRRQALLAVQLGRRDRHHRVPELAFERHRLALCRCGARTLVPLAR